MSLLADALQPSVVGGLFAVRNLSTLRISDSLIAPGSAYVVSFPTQRVFRTDFQDSEALSRITAFDIHRLCSSSLQSAVEATSGEDSKFAMPWRLIRLYYSSFYAAHAIVRLLGGGCCWLESAHIARVIQTATAHGLAPLGKIDAGNYRCELDASATAWTWYRLSGGRGTHETFWNYFESLIRLRAHSILVGPMPATESQRAFAQLVSFLDFGVTHNSHHWLSTVRNDIQYAFAHGVWHPTTVGTKDRHQIWRWAEKWRDDPMEIEIGTLTNASILIQFSAATAFLVALCRTLVDRVAERSRTGRSGFVRYAPKNILNAIASTANS